jgi:hypothetical protein
MLSYSIFRVNKVYASKSWYQNDDGATGNEEDDEYEENESETSIFYGNLIFIYF